MNEDVRASVILQVEWSVEMFNPVRFVLPSLHIECSVKNSVFFDTQYK
jgi:hypothetical protein